MKTIRASLLITLVAITCQFATTAQTIYTAAGNGTGAFAGDGGPATASQLNSPGGVAVDAAGNTYIADFDNNRIRKIDASGTITTIAGTGFGGFLGDGGPATAAWIKWPKDIALDASGNIYISDFGNNVIRKINTSGIISTIAGVAGSIPSYSGDGGPATAAHFGNVWGITVDGAGNVLVADQINSCIRKISTTGIITSIAGTPGFLGFAGDGGPATAARLNNPTGVAVDPTGNIFIADWANNRVRKINTSGIISTIAGIGLPYGYDGDGGPATAAKLYYPIGIDVDNIGNVYVCDNYNNCVRTINSAGIINTFTGNTGLAGFSGDGGIALTAKLNRPSDVAVRFDGDVFIADKDNHRVRHVRLSSAPYFVGGSTQELTLCPIEFINIDSLLKVYDIDLGQTLTWNPATSPTLGTLVCSYSTTSTGGVVTPSTISYAPPFGFTGTDTFSIKVTDGTFADTITFYISVVAGPDAGSISGANTVCPGLSVVLSETVTGGLWTSSDPAVASVDASGSVTGVVAGSAVISYSVSNICGTAVATFNINVSATVPCTSSVPETTTPLQGIIIPNPSNGNFTISFPNNGYSGYNIEIFNILGRSIKKYENINNSNFNISLNEPPGNYVIKILNNNQSYIQRLLIK